MLEYIAQYFQLSQRMRIHLANSEAFLDYTDTATARLISYTIDIETWIKHAAANGL